MSVRSDAAVCRSCGRVDLATLMVALDARAYAFLCRACAGPAKA